MGKQLIRDYVFTPGNGGVGTVEIAGTYALDQILIITNVTDNVVLYNFASTDYAGTTTTINSQNTGASGHWPHIMERENGYTVITLAKSSAGMAATDALQIFVEDPQGDVVVRPYAFGTDAIERMRVSLPESMIDADFEYGLQPTKWAGYGTVKGYPSVYQNEGIDIATTAVTTDYNTGSSSNSLITVTFGSAHELAVGSVVNVTGLNSAVAGFSRGDGSFIVETIVNSTKLKYYARGIVGTSNGQSLHTEETLTRVGGIYAGASIPVTSASSNGANPSIITLNFANPHGLIPGTNIHAIAASGTNKEEASGPFFIKSTPSLTSITYTARTGAVVANPSNITLYALSNATILHRPSDGGVILQTKTPTYAASVVRVSKRYFRYQSGKGFLFSTGTLLAPNYDVRSISAAGTTVGSLITIGTDEIDHGLQPGAKVRLEGIETSGYEGTYVVDSIVDDYVYRVAATQTLGATDPVLKRVCTMYVTEWRGSAVRAGMFDDVNGIFYEFDGKQVYCCKRTSTQQITGTISVTNNNSEVTGLSTRLTEQCKAGDRIAIRGMIHFVTQVTSDTTMYITPDYRGITAGGIKGNMITDHKVPQNRWNLDRMNGTGIHNPSLHTLDVNKMQMVGFQYSWYGAGFIDFMIRGPDGHWTMVHRMKNNNVNNEAFMRSGNLPVRYSIENDSPTTSLTATINASTTTIGALELGEFDDSGTIMIDNEIINYTGRSVTTGPGNFTGCTRSATLTQYQQGTTNNLTAGSAATHANKTGIIEISNTCSPTLSHWGSALVIDGDFDFDRGYIFNYSNSHNSGSDQIQTTPITSFVIRLAPSVSNSSVGRLGAKDLLNRSQLLLKQCSVVCGRGSSSSGEVHIQGIINPKNFSDATWKGLSGSAEGGQPSFAQVANKGTITWSTGSYALPGERVFSFVAGTSRSDSVVSTLELGDLKELSGAPLGGDYKFPDGPDILAVNAFCLSGDVKASIQLRWSEAQA
ncbi:hypothetical protein N9157_02130 [Saprospiraceae bacterium]|nr:hypothetical protein [Saprospiraceae bacterium]